MSKLLEIQQAIEKNQAALRDILAKRGADGKFSPDVQQQLQRANEEYAKLKADGETERIAENLEKELLASQAQAQARAANTSTTGAPQFNQSGLTYDQAFGKWLVQNPDNPTLTEDERRMLQTRRQEIRGTNPQTSDVVGQGGYLVPESFSSRLYEVMKWYGGMLEACQVENDPIGGVLRWPTGDDTANTGTTNTPQGSTVPTQDMFFGRVLFGDWTLTSGIVRLTQEFLQDERVGFTSGILARRLGERIGRRVNTKLTNGTGTNEPYGLTTTATTAGITTAGATAITKAELVRQLHSVDKAYRASPSCAWMMNDSILGYLRTLDMTTDTTHIFVPGNIITGVPDTLLGHRVHINNDLTGATNGLPVSGTKHIYFGDFSAYLIRMIRDVTISRNDHLYWAELEVGFMGFMRLDGNLLDVKAIKYLLQA